MHYLMIKKCMSTGLKYLCKSSGNKDPIKYKGSGIRWTNHIRKHNSYIITCILGIYNTKEELREAGLYYSKLYNVVEDYNWANLTEEKGDGGLIGNGQLGKTWKIKDTSKMKNRKTKTEAWHKAKEKISGKNNYQFTGFIQTPWGTYESLVAAATAAQKERDIGNNYVVSDWCTLKKYLHNLDIMLNKEGRRTPKDWRGKTPRELGFGIIKDKNDERNQDK